MQSNYSTPSLWFFLPPETKPSVSYRRSNLIAIALLAFFAIGLLVIALLPENTTGLALASGQSQPGVGKAAPPVHHVR